MLVGLLVGMINSVLAVRHPSSAAFDRQARVVFRELTEVANFLLILADEAFLDHDLSTAEDRDGAYAHWTVAGDIYPGSGGRYDINLGGRVGAYHYPHLNGVRVGRGPDTPSLTC